MMQIPVKLVCYRWLGADGLPADSHQAIEFSKGQLHGGTTFDGMIDLSVDEILTLRQAAESGCHMAFWLIDGGDA